MFPRPIPRRARLRLALGSVPASSIPAQITAAAAAQGISPTLALSIAQHESNYNQAAIGASGEIGVFQVMPTTAPGVNLADLTANINAGLSYLGSNLATFGGDPAKAAAAYNCGTACVQNAVAQGGANWLAYVPASTQSYVASVVGSAGAAVPTATGGASSYNGDSILSDFFGTSSPAPDAGALADFSGATDSTGSGVTSDLIVAGLAAAVIALGLAFS